MSARRTSFQPPRAAPRRGRGGFTLVELCMGLLITTLVTGALAAFTLAVSTHWQSADGTQSAALSANQAHLRLQKRLHDAKRIGYWTASPAALIYWRTDTNGDLEMQFSELGAIAYDGATQTLNLYEPVLAAGQTDDVWSPADFTKSDAIDRLTADQTPLPLLANVEAATLSVEHELSDALAPTVEFTVALAQPDGSKASETCTATLRGPASPPK